MSRIEGLMQSYDDTVRQPWPRSLAGAEKVWFAIYDPAHERRLLFRLHEFETITSKAGHGWQHLDIAPLFAQWMGAQKYREAYFEDPEAMDLALPTFCTAVADRIRETLRSPDTGDDTVTAISGVGSLFGLVRVANVIEQVTPDIVGRLLVFFPGRYENSRYRLLDARDGWNYLAVPITAESGEDKP